MGIDIHKPIECIILDEWRPSENGALKKLKAVCEAYPDTPPHYIDENIRGFKIYKRKTRRNKNK